MENRIVSASVPTEANTETVAMTTTAAATTVPITAPFVLVTVTALCFVRAGGGAATASCLPLLANTTNRLAMGGKNSLSFIVPTGTGTAYVTPGV